MGKQLKILVMRYRFIGDTLLSVPFLRNLRKAYPDAQIDMLVTRSTLDIIDNCPYVDNLICMDIANDHRYESRDINKTFFESVNMIRKNKYDKTYILKRSFTSAAIAFLAGIKERIGFDTECRGFLLTKCVKYRKNLHEVETFLDVLRADGVEVTDNAPEAWIDVNAANTVDLVLEHNKKADKLVIVHATSGNIRKQWKTEYWREVVKYLANKKQVQIVFLGANMDKGVYSEILENIDEKLEIEPINLCGSLSLKESMALINKADLIVGCDSGNLHMASAVKTPVIGIYGPMSSVKWGAMGDKNIILKSDLECVPCGLKGKCEHNSACLTNITPAVVIDAIDKLI